MYQLISVSLTAACDWLDHRSEKVTFTKILANLLADHLSQQYAHVPKTSVGNKITISFEVVRDWV